MRFEMRVVHERGAAPSWLALLFALLLLAGCATTRVADPLPSWNEGPVKAAIIKLVEDTTRPGSPDFVPVNERIATFDNDGTLWCEHPMYTEVVFTRDRIKALAAQNPSWRTEMPFKAVIDNDEAAFAKFTEADFFKLVAATHAGYTSARIPESGGRLACGHQAPALQPPVHRAGLPADAGSARLLPRQRLQDVHRLGRHAQFHAQLRGEGVRHPDEQVIGTSFEAKYTFDNDVALVKAEPRIMLLDDGPGKGIGIDHFIGRIPDRVVRQFRRRPRDAGDRDQQPAEARRASALPPSSGTPTACASTPTTAIRTSGA